ncbi:P-loop containing nucleoside triphosphate hydrolase protein [Chytridium lagenaria]|nr:P-loop containing nucleoside triphosphate hydrolase protein [Chytridium lagenaria]
MPLTMISAVTVKIMILGDSGVGKSQLFSRLVRNTFDEDSLPTAGIDFATHVMKVSSGQKVKAQIVDTSGLDRFRTIIQSYWALATGALVVYDITNRESFSNIRRWVQDFRAKCNKGLPPSIMVVGNKAEKESEPYREVSTSEAKAYAVAQGFLFMEVSAMDDKDVDLAFSILLTDVYHAVNANSPTPILPIVSPRRGSSPALDPILSSNSGSANASSSRRPSAASVIDAAGDEGTLSRLVHWISGSATDNQGPSPSTSNTVPSDPTSATYVPPNPNAGLPRRASTVSSSYFWPFSSTEESTTSTPSSPSRSAANAVIDGATRAQQALAEAFRSRPPIKTVDDVDSDDDGVSGLRKSSNATSDGYLTSFYDIARNLVGGGEEDRTPPQLCRQAIEVLHHIWREVTVFFRKGLPCSLWRCHPPTSTRIRRRHRPRNWHHPHACPGCLPTILRLQ